MPRSDPAVEPIPPPPPRQRRSWATTLVLRVRLASGLVLFAFVATHLINHALGLLSLASMEAGRWAFLALWRNPVGHGLLGAAILVHLAQACWSLYRRRHLRMPVWQVVQLLLGLTIPAILVNHIVGTAVASELHGYEDSYTRVLLTFWVLRPDLGWLQALLVVVTWTHGCMGVHYWLRTRAGYQRAWMVIYTVYVLLPVLALLGYVQAGYYVTILARDPAWVAQTLADAMPPDEAAQAMLAQAGDTARWLLTALLLLTFTARTLRQIHDARRSIRISYPGNQVVSVPRGFSVLETSRHAGIPHTSICGGRGRCSTCRVRVLRGAHDLPPPKPTEARVLARVGAEPNVRLACQLRPQHDISVLPLIPPSNDAARALDDPTFMSGRERELCVLFADLRGFTRLSEQRLPYDVVFLLNRYFEAVGGAIEAAGGIANQFTGDGVMALFGLQNGVAEGTRQALRAAQAMQDALARLSADLHEELDAPLKIGIGIHSGHTVVGHMGRGVATYLTAVGDTVNTASRLQDQTKEFACPLIVSEAAAQHAGLDTSALRHEAVSVRNRDNPIGVFIVTDLATLRLSDAPVVASA